MSRRRFSSATAVAGLILCAAAHADAGIVSESSGDPLVASIEASPDYSGANFFFSGSALTPGDYPAAAVSETLHEQGTATLTFNYRGFDYGPNGLRPVLNVSNDTGATVTSLTLTLSSPAGSTNFGFYALGSVVASPSGAIYTGTAVSPNSGNSTTIPLSLAAGSTEAIYLPIFVTGGDAGSFSITQTAVTATPEPSSLALCGLGSVVLAGAAWRRTMKRGR